MIALLIAVAMPFWVVIDKPADFHLPNGQVVSLPAGSYFEACPENGSVLVYELGTRTIRFPKPCPLFEDGFED